MYVLINIDDQDERERWRNHTKEEKKSKWYYCMQKKCDFLHFVTNLEKLFYEIRPKISF